MCRHLLSPQALKTHRDARRVRRGKDLLLQTSLGLLLLSGFLCCTERRLVCFLVPSHASPV